MVKPGDEAVGCTVLPFEPNTKFHNARKSGKKYLLLYDNIIVHNTLEYMYI